MPSLKVYTGSCSYQVSFSILEEGPPKELRGSSLCQSDCRLLLEAAKLTTHQYSETITLMSLLTQIAVEGTLAFREGEGGEV